MKFYHATTVEAAERIEREMTIKANAFGQVFFCKDPVDACKFLVIRGIRKMRVFEVELDESMVIESTDHSEAFFGCKAYYQNGDVNLGRSTVVYGYDFG